MKLMLFYFSLNLALSNVAYAINNCPPSGTCGVTPSDLITKPDTYYPPIPPQGGENPEVEEQPNPESSYPSTD